MPDEWDRRRADDYERGRRDGEIRAQLAQHATELRELELGMVELRGKVDKIATRDEVREALSRAVQLGGAPWDGISPRQKVAVGSGVVAILGSVIANLGHTLGLW